MIRWFTCSCGAQKGAAGAIVRKKRIEAIDNVLNNTRENEVDFVLICGDVFEHNMVGSEDVNKVISSFNRFPDIPIILLPGNHDALGPGCVYNRDIFSHLTIFTIDKPFYISGATLYPLPIHSFNRSEDPTNGLPNVKKVDGIHIGVGHGSLLGAFKSSDTVDFPIDPSCIERTGIDYLALGHWHSCRDYADSDGVTRITYSGTHEQTQYDEDVAGYCLLVEIESKSKPPSITKIKSGKLQWESLNLELKDSASINELTKRLSSLKAIDIVQVNLHGELSIELKEVIEKILEYQQTLHTHFRIKDEELLYTVPPSLDTNLDLGDPTLTQTNRELCRLLEKTENNEERAVIIEALSLLNRIAMEE